jgi:hypothetical protein
MVAGAVQRHARVGDPQQRRAELPACRVQEGGVEQPGGVSRRRAGALAGAEREQIGGLGPDDPLIEGARERDVRDAELDPGDVKG